MHVLCEFERHRLVTVPSVTFFRGDRVAINSPGVADGSIALLVVEGLFPRCRAVRLYHLDRLREPVVAIGEELAASLNYYEGVPWKMYGDVPSCFAKEICLEITSESPVRAIREQLSQSTELAQRLLLVSPGFQPRSLRLEDGEETYIVRDLRLASAPNADQFIVQLSPETSMSVAPRITSGVDTVILADCSGSMLVDDLPTEDTSNGGNTDAPAPRLPPAVPKVRGMTRMEKLQRELIDLLRSRLHVPSNGSRMALVDFTSDRKSVV